MAFMVFKVKPLHFSSLASKLERKIYGEEVEHQACQDPGVLRTEVYI